VVTCGGQSDRLRRSEVLNEDVELLRIERFAGRRQRAWRRHDEASVVRLNQRLTKQAPLSSRCGCSAGSDRPSSNRASRHGATSARGRRILFVPGTLVTVPARAIAALKALHWMYAPASKFDENAACLQAANSCSPMMRAKPKLLRGRLSCLVTEHGLGLLRLLLRSKDEDFAAYQTKAAHDH
jgi:hypothetical protein